MSIFLESSFGSSLKKKKNLIGCLNFSENSEQNNPCFNDAKRTFLKFGAIFIEKDRFRSGIITKVEQLGIILLIMTILKQKCAALFGIDLAWLFYNWLPKCTQNCIKINKI